MKDTAIIISGIWYRILISNYRQIKLNQIKSINMENQATLFKLCSEQMRT